ncbi:hypothetical protein BCR33DRAFT_486189 [Rhizoclosmatium globosum]|uniref:Uncharacterized protein n=1 Tax=Rhizoclosmatium globosum TaxID=329046 RepID=A0A1Y2BN48_9FUNG|nr:hypothetical protein BCR33DRAFT_486189 [Rhizoclosmatium globosum]|eukprot:ORY36179.1 hypothetical protein BCR33DRAFT_486189 [Rhizoclosmatium globosum]
MKSLKQKREAAVIKGTADIRSFWAKAPPASHSTSTTTTSSTGSASGSGTGANSGTTIPPKPKPPPSNTNIVKETTAHNIAHTASTSRASNAGGGPSRAPTAPSSNSSSNTINLSKPPLIQSNNNNHNQSRQSEIHPESSPLLPHFSKTPLVSKTYDAVDFPNSQLDATPTSSSSNNGECNIFWRKSPPLEKLKSFVKTVSKTDSEMEIRALSSSLGRVDDIPAKPVTSNDMISELWSQANHSSTSSFSISNSNTRPPHPFLLQSKSPHVPNTSSIATPSHSSASRSKTLKRSQSSSLISEGSPLIYERRAKRQHWASSSSSASNSMSSSLPNSGIKKLTSLLGTLQSLPPIQSRDDLDLSKTAMGTPFRKPFPRSKSSMDVREHERYQLENPPELLDLRQWSSLEKEAKARKENVGRENMGGAPYTANESPVKSYGNQNSHHSKIDSMMEDDDDEDDALFLAAAVELENGTNNNQSLNNTRSMEQSLESSESIVAPKKRAVDEFDDDVEFHPPAIKHEIRQVDEFDDDGGFSSFSDDSAIMDACAFAEREYQATQVAVVREVLESKENVTVSNHLALKSGAEPVVQKGLMDVDEFDDLDFDDGFLEAVDMEAMMKQVDAVEKIHQKQVTVVPVVKVEKRVKHQRFIVLEVQAENANIGGFTIQEKFDCVRIGITLMSRLGTTFMSLTLQCPQKMWLLITPITLSLQTQIRLYPPPTSPTRLNVSESLCSKICVVSATMPTLPWCTENSCMKYSKLV